MAKLQISCVRKFKIDAGHRVYRHESKCQNVHGHEYKFEVYARTIIGPAKATQLDSLGRIIDFGVIKEVIGTWLDDNWDHGMILMESDPIARLWRKGSTHRDDDGGALDDHKVYFLPDNPTAENLAIYLLAKSNELLRANTPKDDPVTVEVFKVVCHETYNCFAIATL